MEGGGYTQETIRGSHPTTDNYRVKNAQIELLHKCRQLYDGAVHDVSQSKEIVRPNASQLYSNNFLAEDLCMIIQLNVAIKDKETNELWNCHMKNENRKFTAIGGNFFIEADFKPNALAHYKSCDCKGKQLPDYAGNIVCKLPIETNDPITYQIRIRLFQKTGTGKRKKLDSMRFFVSSHKHGHDVFDYQEGRNITEIERPQLKIKMTGILADDIGRSIIVHFQNLGDNGLYRQFNEDKDKLFSCIQERDDLRDLERSILLEESILQFGQNMMDECVETAMSVVKNILEYNSANALFLMAKAYYIISAKYRQERNFEEAEEHMVKSTELLEPVFVCEETAVNQYNWAALLSEKLATTPLTPTEKKEAKRCFQNALLLWKQQDQNKTKRCAIRTQIRNINFHLNTTRQKFPDLRKPVPEEDMEKALTEIANFRRNLLSDCSQRHMATFLISESDYFIRKAASMSTAEDRQRNAEKAVSLLNSSLDIAQELNLDKEIEGIRDRLENIPKLQENNLDRNEAETIHCFRDTETVSRNQVDPHMNFIDLLHLLSRYQPELTRE